MYKFHVTEFFVAYIPLGLGKTSMLKGIEWKTACKIFSLGVWCLVNKSIRMKGESETVWACLKYTWAGM